MCGVCNVQLQGCHLRCLKEAACMQQLSCPYITESGQLHRHVDIAPRCVAAATSQLDVLFEYANNMEGGCVWKNANTQLLNKACTDRRVMEGCSMSSSVLCIVSLPETPECEDVAISASPP